MRDERQRFQAVLRNLITDRAPAELPVFELFEDELVDALERGEDVRETFAEARTAGEAKATVGIVVEVAKMLSVAWSCFKVFRAIWGRLAPTAPPTGSVQEQIAQRLVEHGWSPDDANRGAKIVCSTLAEELQGGL